ncbi:MAG: efflux RND transporter periplasmic adaptor subunit [candidate division Zixibacteria bacterium]|nr:efflux RND transporter periplasmic adaptor subunit [candidate division Zixibacteria bacterium]
MTDQEHTHRISSERPWWKTALTKPAFWIVIIVALALGFLVRGGGNGSKTQVAAAETEAATMWTCSMHPQIQLPEPGQCPICFMDLIPVSDGGGSDDDGPRVLSMSETARKIAQIVTTPVQRQEVNPVVHTVGTVTYDQTKFAEIAAWVPGRIDSLYADYVGTEVTKGEPLASIYSPELLSAQEELLQAVAAAQQSSGSQLTTFKKSVEATVKAARERLRLWGLTDAQIAAIEERGAPNDHITIPSPVTGVVVMKPVVEGSYVKTGTPLYHIADLSHVWVEIEAYESDLPWLQIGDTVQFTAEAFPNRRFTGTVSFIDPTLKSNTRTVPVRVDVPNPQRLLKPGMYVNAVVQGQSTTLVQQGDEEPLVIPASAPLITGKRAVVYVELPDREQPTYEGREVILGPRAGDYYVVDSGLTEGDRVVVNGAFKIDSELQIRAKPSMMSPKGEPMPGHDHGDQQMASGQPEKTPHPEQSERYTDVPAEFQTNLDPVYSSYFDLHSALADDQEDVAATATDRLRETLQSVDATILSDSQDATWDSLSTLAINATNDANAAESIDGIRMAFENIAAAMIQIDYRFGHSASIDYAVTYCPMAFNNRGAYWLQHHDSILNPYFGHTMLKCGKVTDHIEPTLTRN